MKRAGVHFLVSVFVFLGAVLGLALGLSSAQSASDVVLYASEASVRPGWNVVTDSSAAGGDK